VLVSGMRAEPLSGLRGSDSTTMQRAALGVAGFDCCGIVLTETDEIEEFERLYHGQSTRRMLSR
jgi:hypothetical protein